MANFNNTKPYICPYCGKDSGLRDSSDYESEFISFTMECSNCGKKWHESFTLTNCEKQPYEE